LNANGELESDDTKLGDAEGDQNEEEEECAWWFEAPVSAIEAGKEIEEEKGDGETKGGVGVGMEWFEWCWWWWMCGCGY
jgi:hypothetical protein